MTPSDVFELIYQGRISDAYESARLLYASDKSPYASTAMYLAAIDKQQSLLDAGETAEADRIGRALLRLQSRISDHLLLGCWGEELAVRYLRKKGYDIVERDWHSNHRDIDIIALLDDTLVFVEVKTRRNRDFSEPESAVNYQKQRNLLQSINHFLKTKSIDLPWRFDVITIVGTTGCQDPEINHIEDFVLA